MDNTYRYSSRPPRFSYPPPNMYPNQTFRPRHPNQSTQYTYPPPQASYRPRYSAENNYAPIYQQLDSRFAYPSTDAALTTYPQMPATNDYNNTYSASSYEYYNNYNEYYNTPGASTMTYTPNSSYPNTALLDKSYSCNKIYEENDYKKSLDEYKKDSEASRMYKKTEKEPSKNSRDKDQRYNSNRRSRSRSAQRSKSCVGNKSRSGSRDVYKKRNKTETRQELKPYSERDVLLAQWRKNYYATGEEMTTKLEELSKMSQEEIIEREKSIWTRTTPADLYYERDDVNPKIIKGTSKLMEVCNRFNEDLVLRARNINALKPPYEPPIRKKKTRLCKHKSEHCEETDSSSEDLTDEEEENIMEELSRKQQHPDRLHPEMWYNDPGEMNDGPLCRCSLKSRKSGIRHGIYAGEQFVQLCHKDTNNVDKLYHYRITISPPTNFLTKTPTIIKHDEHEFIFEGFSMFSHFPLVKLPTCKVIRFNIEYTILYIEEKHPDNFTIRELDLFHDYLFTELLELVDLDFRAAGDTEGCSQFHFMPRFVRDLPDNGREILSMKEVLQYLLNSSKLLISNDDLGTMVQISQYEWQALADEVKGMVVMYPGKKPCSVRVDQLDRNSDLQVPGELRFPEIVHFGIRPPQLSYAGNPEYQKAWRDYVKFRHLLANMSKPTFEDKRKLEAKENKLQEMRTQSKMKRDVTVAVSAEQFYRTGIMCDIVQHAMLIPVLVCHLRFHHSLNVLEENIGYKFANRALLQLALTHPSYRENFGTNPDHARNSLTNCGIRQPEYGDRRIHYMNTRKRGINTLINIMSRFGKAHETESNITHNERLEFLGDAVVEFLSSIHLFRMFPDLEEGGLATYRAAIVQNQHLAVLARTLTLDQYMLYAHGSDLCHDLELRHAMANCFEALMGALFLDGGIDVADKVFGTTLFKTDPKLLRVWENLPPHPLQEQEPTGDRQWIPNFELLQKLMKFEDSIGVKFKHIRLLARAFTDRSIGYTNLTLGSNQRLEFLGDTVLQLIASEYLYKFFPEHHEGHLSLLRSSLVNNRTQAVVCDDLGMANYAVYNNPKAELKTKDRADLLEAFVGALYIDKGLRHCRLFCHVTLFPRLQDFIMNQDWNDPKSKLQQCCLTLRTMDGGEPDIPVYKVIECKGPTNTRVYTVAVYFRGRRLAKATGHSIQQAEMNSAKKALEISQDLFPQLDHQKRVIAKSMKRQKYPNRARKGSPHSSGSEAGDESQRRKSRRSRSLSKESEYSVRDRAGSKFKPRRPRTLGSSRRSRSVSTVKSRKRSRSRSQSTLKLRKRSRSRSMSTVTSRKRFRNRSSSQSMVKHGQRSRSRSDSVSTWKSRKRSRSRSVSTFKSRKRSGSRSTVKSVRLKRSTSRSTVTSEFRKRSRSKSGSVSTFKTRKRSRSQKMRKLQRSTSRSRKRSRSGSRTTVRKRSRSGSDMKFRKLSKFRSPKRSKSRSVSIKRSRSRSSREHSECNDGSKLAPSGKLGKFRSRSKSISNRSASVSPCRADNLKRSKSRSIELEIRERSQSGSCSYSSVSSVTSGKNRDNELGSPSPSRNRSTSNSPNQSTSPIKLDTVD